MLQILAATIGTTAFRGFVATLIGMGAIALKSKLGIELDATAQASLVAMLIGYLAKLGHENHLDALGAVDAPAGGVNPADVKP